MNDILWRGGKPKACARPGVGCQAWPAEVRLGKGEADVGVGGLADRGQLTGGDELRIGHRCAAVTGVIEIVLRPAREVADECPGADSRDRA